jgi:hypothetical protein
MSTDKPDEDNAVVVLNGCDQPIVIAFDIEYHPVLAYDAGVSINGLYVGWTLPGGMLDIIIPGLQTRGRCPVYSILPFINYAINNLIYK